MGFNCKEKVIAWAAVEVSNGEVTVLDVETLEPNLKKEEGEMLTSLKKDLLDLADRYKPDRTGIREVAVPLQASRKRWYRAGKLISQVITALYKSMPHSLSLFTEKDQTVKRKLGEYTVDRSRAGLPAISEEEEIAIGLALMAFEG